MLSLAEVIGVGDVICTRNDKGFPAKAIRFGAQLRELLGGPPAYANINHVIGVHHRDANGTWWGIEGRPGGVGWVDLTKHLESPWTIANTAQTKTEVQRFQIATGLELMLGRDYDWVGIGLDGIESFNLPMYWVPTEQWDSKGTPPAHVVCSSLLDWEYERVKLESPKPDRLCKPTDWGTFILNYERAA